METKKLKIGVDCDEVLAELMKDLNEYYNNIYGTNFKFEDYNTYKVEEIWNVTREKSMEIINSFLDSEYCHKIETVPGSKETIFDLFDKHELIIITSRPIHVKERTLKWLNHHFPNAFSGFHFTDDWPKHKLGTRKAIICKQLGVDWMIEDSLEKSIKCAGNGTRVLLFNRPWNQHDNLPENIIRVSGWEEVGDILK